MHEVSCTITSKGQVTIPKRIRRQIGVEIGDKVSFVIQESGTVELRPAQYTIERLKGIVRQPQGVSIEDLDELFDDAFEERVDQMTGKLRG